MSGGAAGDKFGESLARLETAFSTPLVPGEVQSWVRVVADALEDVESLFRKQVEYIHQLQFARIELDDPALVERVEELKRKDHQLIVDLQKLGVRFAALRKRTAQLSGDESRVEKDVASLAQAGLTFIVNVRGQQTAVQTWILESINRDRGVVD